MAFLALILLAAKAHGRQIRLEREAKGVFSVDFRAQNPPEVEAIWRRDRRTFWPAAVVVATAGIVFTVLLALRPLDLVEGIGVSLALGFAAGFVVAGLASWFRLGRSGWASVGWWLAVAAAATLT